MSSQMWGPWTVIVSFAVAGGLIGGDIALWQWDGHASFTIPVVSGLLTGGLAGGFIAWFVGQMEEIR
jgi:hypothetical protein